MEHKKLMLNGKDYMRKAMDNSLWTFFYIIRIQDLQYTLGTFMLKDGRYYLGPVTSMQNILKKE